VGPRVPVLLEVLKWRFQIECANVAKKLLFQSGPAMISLLKWDLVEIEMKYKKMQEVEEASSMVLFIVGLGSCWNSGLGVRAKKRIN
jgi:hypothetical protein